MIKIISGNIFESKCQTLVNPVNCVGVMGAGLAKAFKEKFPMMFEEYFIFCRQQKIKIGVLSLHQQQVPWILNFPTKGHWKNDSKLEYIESGLKYFIENHNRLKIESVAFPMLGCGLGGLNKNQVLSLLTKYLEQVSIPIEIFT